MPPKFQSSFTPTGAPSVASTVIPQARPIRQYDIFAFAAKIIFGLSILAAFGAVGYQWYLGYSIKKMGAELETMRAEVATGLTGDLIRLNDRIVSTQSLIGSHEVLSPFFAFLTASTPKSVRFTDFSFEDGKEGLVASMRGSARGYAALALEADVLNKSPGFSNPVFSEIRLDEKGDVAFAVKATLSPELVSYDKTVVRLAAPGLPPLNSIFPSATATSTVKVATTTPGIATTTATTTPKTATTTPKTATTTPLRQGSAGQAGTTTPN